MSTLRPSGGVLTPWTPAVAPSGARRPVVRADDLYRGLLQALGLLVLVVIALIVWECAHGAMPSIRATGWHFLVGTDWDPVADHYGALPYLYGTLVTSLIAMLLAVPIGIGAAVFLAELAPPLVGRGRLVRDRAARLDPQHRLRHLGRVRARALAARLASSPG